jgi:cathepsin H
MFIALAIVLLGGVFAEIPSFYQWIEKFNKEYSASELDEREAIYLENVKEINRINNGNYTWVAGVNEYSALTWEEFKKHFSIAPQDCSATAATGRSLPHSEIPDSVDWRDKGMVTPVKNQGSCGSCWTFSTTGAVESAWAIAGNKLTSLAEQQLVDCAGGFKNHGCNGGLPSQAFQYLMWTGGQEAETAYPYTARDGRCAFKTQSVVAKISNEFNITEGDESDTGLPGAIVKNPVSICYQVVSDFRNYKSGVYQSTHCKNGPHDVNHAVLAVGYGTESSLPYYWVKNSWGTSFGIKGYFKIIRNKNMCGLATCSSYPIV